MEPGSLNGVWCTQHEIINTEMACLVDGAGYIIVADITAFNIHRRTPEQHVMTNIHLFLGSHFTHIQVDTSSIIMYLV